MLKRRSDAIYLTEMGAFIARRINCGSVDPFGYYRNTDRIVTILLALIIVVLLTTVSVSVYILCSW